jgi:hypothetical protein
MMSIIRVHKSSTEPVRDQTFVHRQGVLLGRVLYNAGGTPYHTPKTPSIVNQKN